MLVGKGRKKSATRVSTAYHLLDDSNLKRNYVKLALKFGKVCILNEED